MPTLLTTTAQSLAGGTAQVTGVGQDTLVSFTGTWATGDKYTVVFTDGLSGLQTQIGAGNATGVTPTFVYTYKNRVYFLSLSTMYMTGIGTATMLNDPNDEGAGFITMSDFNASALQLQSVCTYQGYLGVWGRNTIQIWNVDPLLANFVQVQDLENIGTFAKDSVLALGDLDVIFLYDSGFRSLRVRDSSLNGFIVDMGSPVDSLVLASIAAGGGPTNAAVTSACGVVDPTTNRYWCFLNDTIYVFSGFPQVKIAAWSTYTATDDSLAAFTPNRFVVYNGQIWCRGVDAGANSQVYQYGGAANATYDATVASWAIDFLDGNAPSVVKDYSTGNFVCSNGWQVFFATDPKQLVAPRKIWDNSTIAIGTAVKDSSYDSGAVPINGSSTHFQFSAKTVGTGPAVFSAFNLFYTGSKK